MMLLLVLHVISAGGVDSGEYAGMCPHHLTAAHVNQACGILLQI